MASKEKQYELEIEDFEELFQDEFVDPDSIELTETDIDDPCVHIDIEKLATYKIDHLKQWLIYRGDQLHGIETLKNAQVRVLDYFYNNTNNNLIDPTTDKTWIRKKAEMMGVILSPFWKDGTLPSAPSILDDQFEEADKKMAGWSKSLDGMPTFTVENIRAYHEKITKLFRRKSTAIKKHFVRGEQMIEERFVDLTSTFAKTDDKYFCVKTVNAASLKKKQFRSTFIALSKADGEITYAWCKCPAGKAGTCSHAYALMKTVLKWVVDRRTVIPEEKACTSKPQAWGVVQTRKRDGNIDKIPISEMTFKSPIARKRPSTSSNENEDEPGPSKESKGISSTLYEARKEPSICCPNLALLWNLRSESIDLSAPKLINFTPEFYRDTTFGKVPTGSILSYQCPLMPPNFNVYCSIEHVHCDFDINFHYPKFPFHVIPNVMADYEAGVYIVETRKREILDELKLSAQDTRLIEERTRDQASNTEWFKHRKNRFTASQCNKLTGSSAPKTSRGFATLARNIINPAPVNQFVKTKLDYGKYYEPIAIKHYEQFMKLQGFKLSVHPSGLVLDEENYVLGATPDGKVICDGELGILEVKCAEQYKDVDPKMICHISPNSMVIKEGDNYCINKGHSYYNQVQMQLALTCQTWCDFVLYTSKGIIIDRVKFDEQYWAILQKKILDFYFTYMLPEILESET